MTITTTTHLNFRNQAREALEFYRSVFGGELMALTYADAHIPVPADESHLLTWGQVLSEDGFHVMAYDVPAARPYEPGVDPVFVSVRSTDEDELRRYWDALAKDATVKAPLEPSGWSPLYGMLTDRFGVTWVMDIAVAY